MKSFKLKRPRKGRCPKCSAPHDGAYALGMCGAYHSSNSCPSRSPPERPSHVVVRGINLTCGELVTWRDTGKLPADVPEAPKCTLYRYVYNGDLGGYVVYRHVMQARRELPSNVMECARQHKQATFVCEDAAADYCRYRNGLVDRNGDDAISSHYGDGHEG